MTSQKCFSLYIIFLITSSIAHPPTKHQMLIVTKLLEDSLEKAVPNDAAVDCTDILMQKKVDTKDLTYYYGGDKKVPVFISYGTSKIGKPFHVLLRGEDFLSPRHSNNFVVLRKLGAPDGAYSVHHAYIQNMGKQLYKGSKVIWNDVKIDQLKDVDGVLQSIGNSDNQAGSVRSGHPRCAWLEYLLVCAAPNDVAPLRPRKVKTSMDEEEDTVPVKLFGITTEVAPFSRKKPFVVVEAKKEDGDNESGSKEGTGDAKDDAVIELDSILKASKIRKRKIQKRHVSVRHRVHIPRRHHASVKK